MSITLSESAGIEAKTYPRLSGAGILHNKITIGPLDIHVEDFDELVLYYLTNTDLEPGDSRLNLIARIKGLHPVPGYRAPFVRLELAHVLS